MREGKGNDNGWEKGEKFVLLSLKYRVVNKKLRIKTTCKLCTEYCRVKTGLSRALEAAIRRLQFLPKRLKGDADATIIATNPFFIESDPSCHPPRLSFHLNSSSPYSAGCSSFSEFFLLFVPRY